MQWGERYRLEPDMVEVDVLAVTADGVRVVLPDGTERVVAPDALHALEG